MSARENLSALLATRGKGGSIESITQAGKHFKADTSLTPSDFISVEKLDAPKATTLFGGYAVARYGIEPKDAFTMRNAFSKRGDEVQTLWDLDKVAFVKAISEIEKEIAEAKGKEIALEQSLGVDAERFIKSATESVEKVVDGNISPKVRHDLLSLKALVERKLAYSPTKVTQDA